jgi:hypothetical protein
MNRVSMSHQPEPYCPNCGGPLPCYSELCLRSLQEQPPLRSSTASQTSHLPPAGVVPLEELFGSAEPVVPQELAAQGGGFKRTEAEVESERGERRKLIVVQWDPAEPMYASAYLAQVLVKPDESLVFGDIRPLAEGRMLHSGKKVAHSLRREPYTVVIGLKAETFETLDQLDATFTDMTSSPYDFEAISRVTRWEKSKGLDKGPSE